jgi:redox-sensitive bicupin YhaK (pirin superfamily)
VKTDDGKVQVKVIAGEALGEHAVVDTRTQITYLHYILKPGAEIIQPLPKDYNIFAYVINGKGTFGKIIKWLREVSLSSSKMMIIRYQSKKGRLEITNRCHH